MAPLGRTSKLFRWSERFSAVAAAVLAGLILSSDHQHRYELTAQMQEHDRLKMDSSQEHIEEYISHIREDLWFTRLNEAVSRLSIGACDAIAEI